MRPEVNIAVRQFATEDQIQLAVLSGDNNPIHMDPVAARRSVAGAAAVHGVRAVLWAL